MELFLYPLFLMCDIPLDGVAPKNEPYIFSLEDTFCDLDFENESSLIDIEVEILEVPDTECSEKPYSVLLYNPPILNAEGRCNVKADIRINDNNVIIDNFSHQGLIRFQVKAYYQEEIFSSISFELFVTDSEVFSTKYYRIYDYLVVYTDNYDMGYDYGLSHVKVYKNNKLLKLVRSQRFSIEFKSNKYYLVTYSPNGTHGYPDTYQEILDSDDILSESMNMIWNSELTKWEIPILE